MAFMGTALAGMVLWGILVLMALGVIGLILCVAFSILHIRAKKQGRHQPALLALAVAGGVFALIGTATLAFSIFLLG